MTNEKMKRLAEIAKELEKLAAELNEMGALGGMLEGRNSSNDYLATVHMIDERVPASMGKISYERFDCGDTHDIERKVRIGNIVFFNIMDKKEAKKVMLEELMA